MRIKPAVNRGQVVVELTRKDEPLWVAAAEKASPLRLKKILVPMDFSGCSKKALQYALPFARQFNAALALLHVVQVHYAAGAEFGMIDDPGFEQRLIDCSEKQLSNLAQEHVVPQVAVQTYVRCGQPAFQIVAAAKELGSDLIILSTHGRTGLKHVFLGSVAENVVRHAPCPVLVVRENQHEFVDEQGE